MSWLLRLKPQREKVTDTFYATQSGNCPHRGIMGGQVVREWLGHPAQLPPGCHPAAGHTNTTFTHAGPCWTEGLLGVRT